MLTEIHVLLVQALESPLLVAVAAGSVALPTLLKLADILVQQGQELSVEDGCLPVEVDLGTVGLLLSYFVRSVKVYFFRFFDYKLSRPLLSSKKLLVSHSLLVYATKLFRSQQGNHSQWNTIPRGVKRL